MEGIKKGFPFKSIIAGILALVSAGIVWDGYYITDEGNITVVKRAGAAVKQTTPGFHLKIPIIDSVRHIDTRERKSVESMAVSTSEQMKAKGIVSINWSAQKPAVIDLFKDYGSLEQFEDKVLDPKLRDVAKTVIARYTAEQNIVNRAKVALDIQEAFKAKIKDLPVTISSVQIEDIEFSKGYLQSIDTKQTQKNLAEAEKYTLEKQNLFAQQRTNVANAEAAAIKVKAAAEAESITIKGIAEASAIKAKAAALKSNPLIIELVKVQNWNGSYLTTGVSENSTTIVDTRTKFSAIGQ